MRGLIRICNRCRLVSHEHHELLLAAAIRATALDAEDDVAAGAVAIVNAAHPKNATTSRENSVFSEARLKGFVIFVLLV